MGKPVIFFLMRKSVHNEIRSVLGVFFFSVPVRYRPNAASGGWGYGRDLVSLP